MGISGTEHNLNTIAIVELIRNGQQFPDFRRTWISSKSISRAKVTRATKAGVNPQLLRRMVGHSDLAATVKFYTHLDPSDILNAINQKDIFSHGL